METIELDKLYTYMLQKAQQQLSRDPSSDYTSGELNGYSQAIKDIYAIAQEIKETTE